MATGFQATGANAAAPFRLKVHRGEGMALLAMDWKGGPPPRDFVGFAIAYREPGAATFFTLNNRLSFPRPGGGVDPQTRPTTEAPIQKFRWVHFPRNAELEGEFTYRVTPVSMDAHGALSFGEPQEVAIPLRRETYPRQLNVTFTRGFVSSQAFVDQWAPGGPFSTLLPADPDQGLAFTPTHPRADAALRWMGFEARSAILEVLDQAIADAAASVRVVAYDLNEPEIVTRLVALGPRLRAIVDDSGSHGDAGSAETQAFAELVRSAGAANVKRQHMGNLQHNKTIVVESPTRRTAVCGSTNFSWRGLYVQSNNALVLHGDTAVELFGAAFEAYWAHDDVAGFGHTGAAQLKPLGYRDVDAQVAFSPHVSANALLRTVADDISLHATSSVLYSLAFLYQTRGAIRDAIKQVTEDGSIFVYGVSDRRVGGLDLQKPAGNVVPVEPSALSGDVPEPFKSEPVGGSGNRMHHKFVVIDFDKPTARVWLGSYNFSSPADTKNGENLLLIRNRRVATAYAVEALRIFDHYHFRVAVGEAGGPAGPLELARAPQQPDAKPWWDEYYTDPVKVRDRKMFS